MLTSSPFLSSFGQNQKPGEVKNWTKRLKRITSVRHRSLLLRIAHGDIYSNSRLNKFGLIDSPSCNNCNCDLETIEHKLVNCPKAAECWQELHNIKEELGLPSDRVEGVEAALGVSDNYSKLSLALNCELLQAITSQGGKSYYPSAVIKSVTRTILMNEPMKKEHRDKLSNLLDQTRVN